MNQKELTKTFMMILKKNHFGFHGLYKKFSTLRVNPSTTQESRQITFIASWIVACYHYALY